MRAFGFAGVIEATGAIWWIRHTKYVRRQQSEAYEAATRSKSKRIRLE